MVKRVPNHRFLKVQKMIETRQGRPSGTQEKALLALLKGKRANTDVTRAHDIHSHKFKREEMECCLLAGLTPFDIMAILEIPTTVTDAYTHLFFDVTVFEDKLDRIDYAYNYPEEYGKELKTLAVDLGKESVMIRASRGAYSIEPKEAQNSIRSTAYIMAQIAKVNTVTSEHSRAALRWAQLCLRAAGELTEEETGTSEKIRIEVEGRDVTTNEKKSGISPAKILHGEQDNENPKA